MLTRTDVRNHRHAILMPALAALLCIAAGLWLASANGPAQASVSLAAPAAETQVPARQGKPLAGLLNPDGTLNTGSGYTGSVDPTGWRMNMGADGEPRFAPAG